MTATTQVLYSARYRLSQAVTKLSDIYPDIRELKTALHRMIDYELKALARERDCPLEESE